MSENRGKSLPNTPTGDQETFKATNRELQRLHSNTTSAPGKFPKRFSIEEAGSENGAFVAVSVMLQNLYTYIAFLFYLMSEMLHVF